MKQDNKKMIRWKCEYCRKSKKRNIPPCYFEAAIPYELFTCPVFGDERQPEWERVSEESEQKAEHLKAEVAELQYIVEQFSKWTAEGGCVKAHHTDFPCWWECNRVELELDDYCDSDDEIKHKCWVEYYHWKYRKARGEEDHPSDTGSGTHQEGASGKDPATGRC